MMVPALRLLPTDKNLAPMEIHNIQNIMIRQHFFWVDFPAPVYYNLFFGKLGAREEITGRERHPYWFYFWPDFRSILVYFLLEV
jgi:hypothetical protein